MSLLMGICSQLTSSEEASEETSSEEASEEVKI